MTAVSYARSKTSSSEGTNGAFAGAVTIVVVATASQLGLDIDPAEASAFTVIISVLVAKFLT